MKKMKIETPKSTTTAVSVRRIRYDVTPHASARVTRRASQACPGALHPHGAIGERGRPGSYPCRDVAPATVRLFGQVHQLRVQEVLCRRLDRGRLAGDVVLPYGDPVVVGLEQAGLLLGEVGRLGLDRVRVVAGDRRVDQLVRLGVAVETAVEGPSAAEDALGGRIVGVGEATVDRHGPVVES